MESNHKTLIIMEDVSIPEIPGFKKGQEVRVCNRVAEILVTRGHAKYFDGKTREQVKLDKGEKLPSKKNRVKVTRSQ